MPRRSVSNDASRSAAPANSRAIRHHVSGVWTSRERSGGWLSPQQPGVQLRCTSICRPGVAIRASERMASTAFSKAASCPWSSAGKRSSIVWLSRRPAAIRTPSARSQGSVVEHGARTVGACDPAGWRRSPTPKGRGRAGTHARPCGSARRRPPQSARPDSFRTCSRWRGASDCARWRPGMALWSVCAGGTEPAREPPSSQRGRCGRSLTARPHQSGGGRPAPGGRTARGADPPARWSRRRRGSRSRTS